MSNTEIISGLIEQAKQAEIVSYNRHGVGAFLIADDLAAAIEFDRHGLADSRYGDEGSAQVRKGRGRKATKIIFNS